MYLKESIASNFLGYVGCLPTVNAKSVMNGSQSVTDNFRIYMHLFYIYAFIFD